MPKGEKCDGCRRKIWTTEWLSQKNRSDFCIQEDPEVICDGGCNFVIKGGTECREIHKKRCKRCYFCIGCTKMLETSGERKTRDEIV